MAQNEQIVFGDFSIPCTVYCRDCNKTLPREKANFVSEWLGNSPQRFALCGKHIREYRAKIDGEQLSLELPFSNTGVTYQSGGQNE